MAPFAFGAGRSAAGGCDSSAAFLFFARCSAASRGESAGRGARAAANCSGAAAASLRSALRDSASATTFFACDVLNRVVELSHSLDPACESAGKIRHRLVILERIVVREQLEGLLVVEVLAPVRTGRHQGEEFLLARIPVELQLARHECDGLQSVAVVLLQRRADGVLTGVAAQSVWPSRISDE